MMNDHSKHGRGTAEDGPDEVDCICRATELEDECSVAGCGFCRTMSIEKLAELALSYIEESTFPAWAGDDCRSCTGSANAHDFDCSYYKTKQALENALEQIPERCPICVADGTKHSKSMCGVKFDRQQRKED